MMMRAQLLHHSDPGAQNGPSPSAEGTDDAHCPLPGLVQGKSSLRIENNGPPLSPTRMRASDPIHSSPGSNSRRKATISEPRKQKSRQEIMKMRIMRSRSTKRFLPSQYDAQIDRASLDKCLTFLKRLDINMRLSRSSA